MDFLVAQFKSADEAQACAQHSDWPRLETLSGALRPLVYGSSFFLIPEKAYTNGTQTYVFDGHAMWGQRAISSAQPSAITLNLLCELQDNLHDAGGIFALMALHTATGECSIALDPLSQFNLFTVHQAGLKVASNNIFLVETILSLVGHNPARSLFSAASEATVGFSPQRSTGLEDVKLFPWDASLHIAPASRAWSIKTAANTARETKINAKQAASRLAQSVAAIHAGMPESEIVYDLTGGLDSRLTLAASRHAGQRHQLIFRSPSAPDYDVEIPNYLAHRYDLRLVDFPQNFNAESLDIQTIARRAVYRQQGQSTLYNAELGQFRLQGLCRIRGGLGEMTRTMYAPRPWRLANIWHRLIYAKDRNSTRVQIALGHRLRRKKDIFTTAFLEDIRKKLAADLADLAHYGLPEKRQLAALYLLGRSRQHFGLTSQMLNRVRPSFEPLAHITLWQYAAQFSEAELRRGTATFQLLASLDNDMAHIPVHAPGLRRGHPFMPYTASLAAPAPTRAHIRPCPDAVITDRQPIDGATRKLTGHAAVMAPYKELFFDLLFALPKGHSTWRIMNRAYFEQLYTARRHDYLLQPDATFLRLFYGLLWVHRLEDPTPISEIY